MKEKCGKICICQKNIVILPHFLNDNTKFFNDMDEQMVIAHNLKRYREANGCTQEHVANYLNVGRSAYANYESGDRACPLRVLEKLADLYGCDAYAFFQEDTRVVDNMLTTAFRVNNVSPEDLVQIAAFKRVVKNYLMMDNMLKK